MIKIKNFVFNPFQENTYVLFDNTGECVIVDAGCYFEEEYSELYDFISSKNLKPVKLINTHAHIDHILGVPKISSDLNLEPAFHKDESYLFKDAFEQGKIFGLNIRPLPEINNFLEEESHVKFGNSQLEVLQAPGHTKGSVVFVSLEDKFLITGDVLFKGSIGRTDLPGGSYEVLMKSIKNKILPFKDDFLIFPGHGPSSSLGEEKRSNPFLL